LNELHAGGEAEFGVDVGEVGLHAARRHEKPGGDSCLEPSMPNDSD